MHVGSYLTGYYDYRLVALSILIAVFAAYACLDLASRIARFHGRFEILWLGAGAAAMGTGIWAMHYVGLEAFILPIPVQYDWPTVLLSLLTAVFASGMGLYLVSRSSLSMSRTIAGGVFMGGGISLMHYIGMAAMRLPAMCLYSPSLVILSVVIAVASSMAALRLTFSYRNHSLPWGLQKFTAALILGLAIPAMHYVGMAAVHFTFTAEMNDSMTHAVDVSGFDLATIIVATFVILGTVLIVTAIDRRFSHQAEILAENRLHLQTIFDTMSEGILVMGQDHKVALLNPAALKLLSLQENDRSYSAVSERFEAFSPDGIPIPPDEWPSARALRGDFVSNFNILYRNKANGEIGAREISTAPIPDRRGIKGQVILRYRDTTESRRVDEARNRLASIVESSDDAIIGKDIHGIINSWNKGAEKVFGYTAAEMIGQSIKRLVPPGKESEEDEILERILRNETVDHFNTVRKTKDERLIYVSLTISPIKDTRGTVVGASKIARDITSTRNLEHQLMQSQKLEAIGQLTGGISHDFNNLLGVILGNLDLLERVVQDNPAAIKRVNTAQRAATRGADLTRRLLAFSSKEELKPSFISLEESIENMLDLAARTLGPDIKIATLFDKSVPRVHIDVARLESALLNLAVNARDAMPKGGILTISTQLRMLEESYPPVMTGEIKPGPYALVSVSDTGHGMSKQTLERAFEPFFTTKPRGKGTGLGLAMVYGFVKQSCGNVRIYSEPGHGTTVSFYLPVVDRTASGTHTIYHEPAPAKVGGTVLVVDDEADLIEIATAYLTDMGYSVLQARDGQSALRILAQHSNIDLVLTDVIMPGGLNGADVAQRARQLNKEIKVIYCSGFSADFLEEKSVPIVDAPLLLKPYLRTEFSNVVRRAMAEGPNLFE